jgi:raffinose/stachyose/melibiose transport system permease protein
VSTTLTTIPAAPPPPDHQSAATDVEGMRRKATRSNKWGTIGLILPALGILIPLYFVVVMSLKYQADSGGSGLEFPTRIRWANFSDAWELVNAPRALAMSITISTITIIGNLLLSSMMAWAVVRNWESRLFRWSFVYLLAAMFLPFTVLALPQVKLMSQLGLDNPIGVGILHTMFGLGFNTLLFSAYIRSLPVELEESATIDGCSTFEVYRKVVWPLLAPMAATIGIFSFLGSWNDFMMPSLIISDIRNQTLPVVQNSFNDQLTLNYNVAFASYFLAMAPALIGYLIARRWIISGIMRGAIK